MAEKKVCHEIREATVAATLVPGSWLLAVLFRGFGCSMSDSCFQRQAEKMLANILSLFALLAGIFSVLPFGRA